MMLISDKPQLLYQRLESESPRQAWYEARIEQHDGGGYLIIKKSGSYGRKGHFEIWFRWSLADAVTKFQQVMGKKLKKKAGRLYKPTLLNSIMAK